MDMSVVRVWRGGGRGRRLRMTLLPIRQARLGAAALFGYVLLPQAPIEADPAEVVAEGPGLLGIPRACSSVLSG